MFIFLLLLRLDDTYVYYLKFRQYNQTQKMDLWLLMFSLQLQSVLEKNGINQNKQKA